MLRFVVSGLVAALAFAGCLEGYPTEEGAGDDSEGADQRPDDPNGPDDTPDDGENRSSTYVFAWITGNYTARPPPGEESYASICGYPSEPEVDEVQRTIHFHEAGSEGLRDRDLVALRGLVLLTQWDYSGCGLLITKTETVWNGDQPTVTIELLGNLTLGMRLDPEDASVTLFQDETPEENAVVVEEGEAHSARYDGENEDGWRFHANYTLRAMGGWPASGITFADA